MAVLVAIAIPVFTSRLEQSRETTDIANLRSAYAAGQVAALSGDENGSPITSALFAYDPDDPDGLVSAGNGIKGQGTATDGHAKTDALPSVVTYETDQDVRTSEITIAIDSGSVTAVSFVAAAGGTSSATAP